MYDLEKLPLILETAGIGSTSSLQIFDDWHGLLTEELNRRTRRKRNKDDSDHPSGTPLTSQASASGGSSIHRQPSSVFGTDSQSRSGDFRGLFGGDDEDTERFEVPDEIDPADSEVDRCEMRLDWPEGRRVQEQSLLPVVSDHSRGVRTGGRRGRGRGHRTPQIDPVPNDEQVLEFLRSLPHEELVQLALRQTRELRGWQNKFECTVQEGKKKLKRFGQQRKRLRKRIRKQKEETKASKKTGLEGLDVFRNKSRYLTWRGSVSLGLRKAIALASASTFPQASLLEVSRQCVTRAELVVDELLITRAIVFNKFLASLLKQVCAIEAQTKDEDDGSNTQDREKPLDTSALMLVPRAETGLRSSANIKSHDDAICHDLGLPLFHSDPVQSLASLRCDHEYAQYFIGCTYWAGDATNSSIWQRQKLVGMLTKSVLLRDVQALTNEDYLKAFCCIKALHFDDNYDNYICQLNCFCFVCVGSANVYLT